MSWSAERFAGFGFLPQAVPERREDPERLSFFCCDLPRLEQERGIEAFGFDAGLRQAFFQPCIACNGGGFIAAISHDCFGAGFRDDGRYNFLRFSAAQDEMPFVTRQAVVQRFQ